MASISSGPLPGHKTPWLLIPVAKGNGFETTSVALLTLPLSFPESQPLWIALSSPIAPMSQLAIAYIVPDKLWESLSLSFYEADSPSPNVSDCSFHTVSSTESQQAPPPLQAETRQPMTYAGTRVRSAGRDPYRASQA